MEDYCKQILRELQQIKEATCNTNPGNNSQNSASQVATAFRELKESNEMLAETIKALTYKLNDMKASHSTTETAEGMDSTTQEKQTRAVSRQTTWYLAIIPRSGCYQLVINRGDQCHICKPLRKGTSQEATDILRGLLDAHKEGPRSVKVISSQPHAIFMAAPFQELLTDRQISMITHNNHNYV